MKIQPAFPPHRRRDPRRSAEAGVYDQLADSSLPGQAFYEVKPVPEAPELDFALWLEGKGRFGIQVKGGSYSINGTVWTLRTNQGEEHVPCPLTQTWDAAIAVRDAVHRVLGFKTFIIPVLLFTDTPPDPSIKEWAWRSRVKVLFGADNLVDRLLKLADRARVQHPPTAAHILNEVEAVTNGLVMPERDSVGKEAVCDPTTRQVLIHHVDTVNIYVTQADFAGWGLQTLPAA